jgi:hypothetical protein
MGFTFVQRLLFLIIGVPLGFLFLLKSLPIVNILGKSAWSEAHMPGGTYGAVKLFGIALIVLCIIFAF